MTRWPFTSLELTAGLRRYLADPTLKILDVVEEPVPVHLPSTPVRGVGIDVERWGHREHYSYMLTQPRPVRLGLPGAGRREVGFHRSQTFSLSFALPEMVTADLDGGWIMLEPYPPRFPLNEWSANDYQQAMINLAAFHDRYWGMDEDLAVYPWVAFPLARDFETVCLAAAKATEAIVQNGLPVVLCGSIDRMVAVARLISQSDRIARVLRTAPQTLLHGDFWPGNISVDEDERFVVYDWQAVSAGPGVFDLLTFVLKSRQANAVLPVTPDELVWLYRYTLATQVRIIWSESEWQQLWDYALMWRFLQEQLTEWADPQKARAADADPSVEKLWLDPVVEAVDRWLDKYSLT